MIKQKKRRNSLNFIKTDKENIYFSKRGLSQVVATLLIILLALVAVGVVWGVINNILKTGSEKAEIGQFTLNLEIESVQVQQGGVTLVVIRRNAGEGEFIGMNFVFSDGQNSEIIREDITIEELGRETFTFTLSEIDADNLKSVSVYPIFKLGSGKESFGNPSDIFEVTGGFVSAAYGGAFEELGLIGKGTTTYTLSSGDEKLPEFKSAVVDPLDVLPGDNQTFTVTVYSPYNVLFVTSTTELDNSILNLDFEKISDDEAGTSTWKATWIVNDTHAIEYRTNITATDSAGNENSVGLSWTDSCQSDITQGQENFINTEDCSTLAGSVGGLDMGKLTIASGFTMTLSSGSTWVYNGGADSIQIEGVLAFEGGKIKKGYLFYLDTDGDNYTGVTYLNYSTSSTLSGYVRAKDREGTAGEDCYDNNNNVFPGQTAYFTSQYAIIDDGTSWDYNCDTITTKQYTATGGGCVTCNPDGVGGCNLPTGGGVGWSGGSPACGSSGTYYTNKGSCNPEPNPTCGPVSCSSESRTQGCH